MMPGRKGDPKMLRTLMSLVVVAAAVRAGAECKIAVTRGDTTETAVVTTDGSRLMHESETERVVFLGDEMFVEQKERKIRMRVARKQIEEGLGALAGGDDAYAKAKAQMEQALAQMPDGPNKERARKTMEEHLKRLKPAGEEEEKAVERRFVEEGEAEIDGKTYRKTVAYEGEKRVAEYYLLGKDEAAPLAHFLPAFKKLDAFLASMPQRARKGGMSWADVEKLGRFPVITRRFEDGKLVEETRVSDWKEKDVGDAAFAPDPECKEQSFGR
jgi:hypothetical protein